jgi:hypothetical protein
VTFTVTDVAPRWRVPVQVAEQFLSDFRSQGLVALTSKGWQVTEAGQRLAAGLQLLNLDAPDHSHAARHRRRPSA